MWIWRCLQVNLVAGCANFALHYLLSQFELCKLGRCILATVCPTLPLSSLFSSSEWKIRSSRGKFHSGLGRRVWQWNCDSPTPIRWVGPTQCAFCSLQWLIMMDRHLTLLRRVWVTKRRERWSLQLLSKLRRLGWGYVKWQRIWPSKMTRPALR